MTFCVVHKVAGFPPTEETLAPESGTRLLVAEEEERRRSTRWLWMWFRLHSEHDEVINPSS